MCVCVSVCVDEACEHEALQQGAAGAAARDKVERVGVLTHVGVAQACPPVQERTRVSRVALTAAPTLATGA